VWPSLLPGGDHLLYTLWDDRWRVVARSLADDTVTALLSDGHDARYAPTGHLVFAQGWELVAAPFDVSTLEVGDPRVVVDNLVANTATGWGSFAFSDTGTLVYLEDPDPGRDLIRIDIGADGARTRLNEERRVFSTPRISPDQDRVLVSVAQPPSMSNIYLLDLAGNRFEPLTTGQRWDVLPVFSTDGTRLLFAAEDRLEGHVGFRVRPLDGLDRGQPLGPSDLSPEWISWSRDGALLYAEDHAGDETNTQHDLWVLEPGAETPERILGDASNELQAEWSPDGSMIAFSSDRTGRYEVYVVEYPIVENARQVPVSRNGGVQPRWSGDSRTIWFANDNQLFAARRVGDGPETAEPELFAESVAEEWDVAADGSFVITLDVKAAPKLRMIQNFFELLEERVPTSR
jgi:dipeptidyl aminopeptidase/acylaminoacyl peptidase